MTPRPPVPPFTEETARQKVQAAEDAWNSRDPDRVALAYTEDSEWRNRDEFFQGRDAIREFLRRKWAASRSTGSRRSSGASPATASRSASSTNRATRRVNGGAATATSTGSSTRTASCDAGMPASTTTRSSPASAGTWPTRGHVGDRRMTVDDVPVLIAGGSLVGLSTALFLGEHGVPSLVVERHPRHGDPPSRGARQPAHDRALPQRRPRARDHGGVRARVRAERRHRVGRVAGRARARVLLPQHQRGRREPEPVAAAVHHPDRPRADPRRAGRGARRTGRVGHRAGLVRVGRRRRHGRRPRSATAAPSERCAPDTSSRRTGATARSESGSGSRSAGTGASRTASRSTSAPTSRPLLRRSQPERDLRLRTRPSRGSSASRRQATRGSSSSTRRSTRAAR